MIPLFNNLFIDTIQDTVNTSVRQYLPERFQVPYSKPTGIAVGVVLTLIGGYFIVKVSCLCLLPLLTPIMILFLQYVTKGLQSFTNESLVRQTNQILATLNTDLSTLDAARVVGNSDQAVLNLLTNRLAVMKTELANRERTIEKLESQMHQELALTFLHLAQDHQTRSLGALVGEGASGGETASVGEARLTTTGSRGTHASSEGN